MRNVEDLILLHSLLLNSHPSFPVSSIRRFEGFYAWEAVLAHVLLHHDAVRPGLVEEGILLDGNGQFTVRAANPHPLADLGLQFQADGFGRSLSSGKRV